MLFVCLPIKKKCLAFHNPTTILCSLKAQHVAFTRTFLEACIEKLLCEQQAFWCSTRLFLASFGGLMLSKIVME